MIRTAFNFVFLKTGRTLSRTMSSSVKPTVLVTRNDYPKNGIALLETRCNLKVWDSNDKGPMGKKELLDCIKGVDGVFCCLTDKFDREVIEAAEAEPVFMASHHENNRRFNSPSQDEKKNEKCKQLRVIATMSVGVDHVDRSVLKENCIRLGYTPDVLTEATAELTVALLLATSRRLFEANKAIRQNEWISPWAPVWMCGPALKGSTVGVYGFGRIGQSVARKLKAFEVSRILYSSENEKPEGRSLGAINVSFDDFLSQSDFIVVTCALSDRTKGIFHKAAFEKMKPTAIFVNSARGGVVNQDDLIEVLRAGKIRAAGLDVMTPEPIPSDHPLMGLGNCVVLPHIGSATYQARMAMSELVAANILAALDDTAMPAEFKL